MIKTIIQVVKNCELRVKQEIQVKSLTKMNETEQKSYEMKKEKTILIGIPLKIDKRPDKRV